MSIVSSHFLISSSHHGLINLIEGGGRLGLVWWGQDAQILMWNFWGVLGTKTCILACGGVFGPLKPFWRVGLRALEGFDLT